MVNICIFVFDIDQTKSYLKGIIHHDQVGFTLIFQVGFNIWKNVTIDKKAKNIWYQKDAENTFDKNQPSIPDFKKILLAKLVKKETSSTW